MFTRREYLLLGFLAFIQFSHIVDFMIMMPLGPQLMRIFQITPHQFGLLVSGYTFSAGVSGLVASSVIDRFDRKRSLLFFYVGFCLSTLSCAFVPSYEIFLLARILTGAFGGVLGSLVLAIVGDSVAPERRGTAMGIVTGGFALASVLGVPLSLFLANKYSWHAPFIFLGGLTALLTVVITRVIPPMRRHLQTGKNRTPLEPFQRILQSKNQMLALCFMCFLVLGQFFIIPFLSPSLVANAGMTERQLPLIYLCGGIASIIVAPIVGRLADKYGKRKVFNVALPLSILPVLVITNLGVTPVPLILCCTVFFFICVNGRMIPAMAMMQGTVHNDHRGGFMGVTSSFQQFAAAIGSYVAGVVVVKDASTGHLLNYPIIGIIAACFSLLALWAAQKIQPIEGTF